MTMSQHNLLRFPMMKHLRDAEPISENELAEILRQHHAFILSGCGGGTWHTFSTGKDEAAIIFGVYLERKDVPPGHQIQITDLAKSLLREQAPPDPVAGKQAKLSHKRLEGNLPENLFLPYADLCGISCARQSLKNANLEGSLLVDSDLTETDFTRACLASADLSRCDMRGACLRYADLTGADLENADLSGADLRDAILNGAKLTNTLMENCLR